MAIHRIQELLGLMQKNLECSICLELMKNPVATKCEHYFCRFCIIEFLETKRSAPCPLCKQPITKRGLKEKGELGGIVRGINSLVSAFQEDSGTVYSPPKGPPSFFPCTPESINSKPDSNKRVKTRRNLRTSGRLSKATEVDAAPDAVEQDAACYYDDIFARPRTSSQGDPPLAATPSTNRASTARPSRVNQARSRDRSRSRSGLAAAVVGKDGLTEGLLQYLDEGSCGFDGLGSGWPAQEAPPVQPRSASREKAGGNASQTTGLGPRGRAAPKPSRAGASHVTEVLVSGEQGDGDVEPSRRNEDGNGAKVGQMSMKKLDVKQTDKENLVEGVGARSQKRSKREQPRSGLANGSDNSSDMSISSTQQFLQPRPVLTRTYGRRSRTKSSFDTKVAAWMATLPVNQNSANEQVADEQAANEQVADAATASEHKAKNQITNEEMTNHVANDQHSEHEHPGGQESDGERQGAAEAQGDGDAEEAVVVKTVVASRPRGLRGENSGVLRDEDVAKLGSSVPEPCEEPLLTPPIRKKRIFKRRDAAAGEDLHSPWDLCQDNSPTADPYVFVVGTTPVDKRKKRGRSRWKEKKGKPLSVGPFTLDKEERKRVRFSEVTANPDGSCFTEEGRDGQKDVSNANAVSDLAQQSDMPTVVPLSKMGLLFVTANEAAACSSVESVPEPNARSGRRSQNKMTKKKGADVEGDAAQCMKTGTKSSGQGGNPAMQKGREVQVQELASWIGQAEEHELLFSTQEAYASLESQGGDSRQGGGQGDEKPEEDDAMITDDEGAIVLVADEDSNDSVCLVGPISDEGQARHLTGQQKKRFNVLSGREALVSSHAKGDVTAADKQKDSTLSHGNEQLLGMEEAMPTGASQDKHSPTHRGLGKRPLDSVVPTSLVGTPTCRSRQPAAAAESQLPPIHSPASGDIVLPSPMVGATLPKFSTPKLQTARQTRSTPRGLAGRAGGIAKCDSTEPECGTMWAEDGTPGRKISRRASRMDSSAAMGIGSTAVPHGVVAAVKQTQSPEGSATGLSPNPTLPPALSNKENPLAENRDGNASPSPCRQQTELSKRALGRLRRQRGGSAASSPSVTAVPSTFTEEMCSGGTGTSPGNLSMKSASQEKVAEDGSCCVLTCVPETAESASSLSRSPHLGHTASRDGRRQKVGLRARSQQRETDGSSRAGDCPLGLEEKAAGRRQSGWRREADDEETAVTATNVGVKLVAAADSDNKAGSEDGGVEMEMVGPSLDGDTGNNSDSGNKADSGNNADHEDVEMEMEVVGPTSDDGEDGGNKADSSNKAGSEAEDARVEKEVVGPTLDDDGHPDGDADSSAHSSSTEDLDIMPAAHEFEAPDITLQTQCGQKRLASGDTTQDSLLPTPPRAVVQLHGKAKRVAGEAPVHHDTASEDSQARKDTVAISKEGSAIATPSQSVLQLGMSDSTTVTPSQVLLQPVTSDSATVTPSQPVLQPVTSDSATVTPSQSVTSDSATVTPSQPVLQSVIADSATVTPRETPLQLGVTDSATVTPSQSVLQSVIADSATVTPSQTLLQPVGTSLSSGTASQSLLQSVAVPADPGPLTGPVGKAGDPAATKVVQSAAGESQASRFSLLSTDLQTKAKEWAMVDDPDSAADQMSASPEQRKEDCHQAGGCGEAHKGHSDTCGGEEDHAEKGRERKARLLVQDTQCAHREEYQGIPLLSQQVVMESLSAEIGPEQSADDEQLMPESQAVDTFGCKQRLAAATLPTSPESSPGMTLTSPRRSLQQSEQPGDDRGSRLAVDERSQGVPKEDPRLSSGPPSGDRKKGQHGQDGGSKAKLAKSPSGPVQTPGLRLLESPSTLSGKVVSSAPPCPISLLSDTDDDDAVLIVRRTKRKCFSLDGSPLRAKAPLSAKRRRHGGWQRNLCEKFEGGSGGDVPESQGKRVVEVRSGRSDGGQINVTEGRPFSSGPTPDGDTCLQKEMEEQGLDKAHPHHAHPATDGPEGENDRASDNKDQCCAVSNVSPTYRRKKTVRGLARLGSSASAGVVTSREGEGHTILQAHYTPESHLEQGGRQQRLSVRMDGSLSERRQAGVEHVERHPAEDMPTDSLVTANLSEPRNTTDMEPERSAAEERMEIDDADVTVENSAVTRDTDTVEDVELYPGCPIRKVKTASSPRQAEADQRAEKRQQAAGLDREGEAGGDEAGPILITQSSHSSQSQQPPLLTQTSEAAGTEDATVPPPDFDLRFEEEEEDEDKDMAEGQQSVPRQHTDTGAEQNIADDRKGNDNEDQAYGAEDGKSVVEVEGEAEILCAEVAAASRGGVKRMGLRSAAQGQRQASASDQQPVAEEQEEVEEEEEEEQVVMKKRNRRAIIDSDTDSDSDRNSGGDSEASFQLNFTSSSAVSTQSEVPTTQERSKMETELERLRKEIAEMEARLQGRLSSSKSDSVGDGRDVNTPICRNKKDAKPCPVIRHSSDDEAEELPGGHCTSSERRGKSVPRERPVLQARRSRRCPISSDEEEEPGRQPEQQVMDADVCVVTGDVADGVCDSPPAGHANSQSSLHTPVRMAKDGKDTELSDEDSSDLFLSPLSPSPPPPTKLSLARKETYLRPRSLFAQHSPSPTRSSSSIKIRQSLNFVVDKPNDVQTRQGVENPHDAKYPRVVADVELSKYDDIKDSQESNMDTCGSLKKIPESQFSASGGCLAADKSDQKSMPAQRDAAQVRSKRNPLSILDDADIESSGSPLPSPLKVAPQSLKTVGEQQNVSSEVSDGETDDSSLPRWRRRRIGFISSGLDAEKLGVLRKLAEMNECKVYSKFNENVTHVIMKTNAESRVCERTLKYFQGIAGQCWVLSFDWVTHSLQAGHFLPEIHFEIEGDSVKGEKHGGPRAARLATSPLLDSFAFASVGVSPDMSKKELTQLLSLTGAEVVDDPWELASQGARHKLVLRCVNSDTQPPTPAEIELFNGQYKHLGLVTVAREWILDSIGTHHLQPLADYVFNTCKHLHLPF